MHTPVLNLHAKRIRRLNDDYERLLTLQAQSDLIHIQVINQRVGWPPEEYLVTFAVKGIARVDEDQRPVYSEFHQVEMTIPPEYPATQPHLLWRTPIWHPNIAPTEPRHVCTDENNSYHPGKRLDQLVVYLAEMAQYKIYHAKMEPPYPWDNDVAAWVRDVAEPTGLIAPGKPVDSRSVYRRIDVEFGQRSAEPKGLPDSDVHSFGPDLPLVALGQLIQPAEDDEFDIKLGSLETESSSE
jgi:ubiquitin-protein ligase